MKRISAALLLCFLLLIAPQSFAQEVAAHAMSASLTIAAPTAANLEKTPTMLSAPNAKIANALTRLFPQAAQQQWWQHGTGFYVQFLNNDQKAQAVFNKKGALEYAITQCRLEQLPLALRQKIEQHYMGYTLLNAVEINAHNAVAYRAVMENEQGYVTLKAVDDDVEVLEAKQKISAN